MLNETSIVTVPAIVADAVAASIATDAPATEAVSTVKPKRVRKPKPVAAAKPVTEAAPVVAPKPEADAGRSFSDERAIAQRAVADFYTSGTSFPFKPASTRLSDFNPSNAKAPSPRTAAMLAAMLAYAGDNIKPDGTFTRGGFRVPASLIDPNAKRGDTVSAMPESGCLGNIAGRIVTHVSGPIGGKQARDGIFRLNLAAVETELQQLGDASAKPAIAVLRKLRKAA